MRLAASLQSAMVVAMNTIAMQTHRAPPRGAWLRWGGLAASWLLLLGVVRVALWDFIPLEAVPPHLHPLGWQRDLHDFITYSGVSTWLPLVIVAGSIALFAWGYRRARHDPQAAGRLIQHFTLASALAVIALQAGTVIVAFLPLHLAPPPSYGYAIKFMVKDIVVLALLGWYQSVAARHSRAIADS